MLSIRLCVIALAISSLGLITQAVAEERTQRFDHDPNWVGFNNRSTAFEPRTIVQDFGHSLTRHAGGTTPGEIGGMTTPSAEPAYYAKIIADKTFNDPLSASGTFFAEDRQFHILVGFFNAGTLKEWRTPNTIALRLYGRGDVFYAYVEYCTSRWRAGGDSPRPFPMLADPATGRSTFKGFSGRTRHQWSLRYDPSGNNGLGTVVATIDGETAECHLDPGHKVDGASFNRCGMLNVMKSADDGGKVWLDDIVINAKAETFMRDPGWEGFQNRRTYVSEGVRPRFNFGYSATTRNAGGQAAGEIGGLVYRGDNRTAEKLAYYGDRVEVGLEKPFRVAGKIALLQGVSDSSTLFGFFNSHQSIKVGEASNGLPRGFLGMAIEGPSRDGFLCYPAANVAGDNAYASGARPAILPDGKPHDFSITYEPLPDGGGKWSVTLDGKATSQTIAAKDRQSGATFDRLGLITSWVDGNSQKIYFDDLVYTSRQD